MTTISEQQHGTGEAVPLATDDQGYLDFVEALRTFNQQKIMAVAAATAGPILQRRAGGADIDTVVAEASKLPIMQLRDRIARSGQEMMHRGVLEPYRHRQDELLAQLADSEHSGPGSVSFEVESLPEYVRRADIHIQPGSYDEDPLAGYVYHRTTDVFYLGNNNRSEMHQAMIDAATARVEAPRRILDLGGSVGQSATALKIRFPEAEVHSIDLGAPMVRYGHKRAVDMGLDVRFHQMAAEDLSSFEDGSFDLVFSLILFHELPVEVTRRVVAEVRRVLRPGGTFVVLDFSSGSRTSDPSPLRRYIGWFDGVHNGEPFAAGFVSSNFEGLLAEHFSEVDPRAQLSLPLGALQARIARA